MNDLERNFSETLELHASTFTVLASLFWNQITLANPVKLKEKQLENTISSIEFDQ